MSERHPRTRHPFFVSLIAGLLMVIGLAGCGEDRPLRERENRSPEILWLRTSADTVLTTAIATLRASATDADLDTLGFTWTATMGTFSPAANDTTRTWHAPDAPGTARISVTVTDGEGEVSRELDIVVTERTGVLTGTVRSASVPDSVDSALPGVEVRAELLADRKRTVVDSTDVRGRYRLTGLALGPTEIRFSKEGYLPLLVTVPVREGPGSLSLVEMRVVQPLSNVHGVVRNTLLAPVAGAVVAIGGIVDTTDAQGLYDLSAVERGERTLTVNRLGYAPASLTLGISLEDHAQDVELDASPLPGPTGVTLTKQVEDLRLLVTWGMPSGYDTVKGYRIYQSIDGGPYASAGPDVLGAGSTQLLLTGQVHRRYQFFVSGINIEDEEGNPSVPSVLRVLTPPSTQVLIPAGRFVMGDTPEGFGSEEHPGNPVDVPAYRIETTEVSNRQMVAFLFEAFSADLLQVDDEGVSGGGNLLLTFAGSRIASKTPGVFEIQAGYEDHPMVGVTWHGARAYASWIGRRLPSEAEWEKAARGVSPQVGLHPSGVGYGTPYPWGTGAVTRERANYQGGIGRTEPVVSRTAGAQNDWGAPLYCLAGNVWEWCEDWSGAYRSPHAPPVDGSSKVLRGGSFQDAATWLSVGARFAAAPDLVSRTAGFRCASTP